MQFDPAAALHVEKNACNFSDHFLHLIYYIIFAQFYLKTSVGLSKNQSANQYQGVLQQEAYRCDVCNPD